MAHRIPVTLYKPDRTKVVMSPYGCQHYETDDLSVETWSQIAVKEMLEAAEKAVAEVD